MTRGSDYGPPVRAARACRPCVSRRSFATEDRRKGKKEGRKKERRKKVEREEEKKQGERKERRNK